MRITRPEIRSFFELPLLDKEANLGQVIDYFNRLVDNYNFFNKALSLNSNFDGVIKEVFIASGQESRIYHELGTIPKYRIILRQQGNGVITDNSEGWTDAFITLKNNGVEDVTAIIIIVRE